MHQHSIVHRALVTYSNKHTGEIRVKIPAVLGQSEIALTKIGRLEYNSLWVVPEVGEQIIVSADDHLLTNVFWVQSDGYVHTKYYRNYFEAYSTASIASAPWDIINNRGVATPFSYTNVIFSEGISLVNNSKITFAYEGVYNLQYSVQWVNIDSQAHDTAVWIDYNGSPYPNSTTYTSIPSSHGGVAGTAVTAINFIGYAHENDYVELVWSTNDPTITYTTLTPGWLAHFPPTVPTSPSIIVTVTQVA